MSRIYAKIKHVAKFCDNGTCYYRMLGRNFIEFRDANTDVENKIQRIQNWIQEGGGGLNPNFLEILLKITKEGGANLSSFSINCFENDPFTKNLFYKIESLFKEKNLPIHNSFDREIVNYTELEEPICIDGPHGNTLIQNLTNQTDE